MNIIERIEMADLGAINRILRKRGLVAKITEATENIMALKVSVLPTPAPKPAAPELPMTDDAPAAEDYPG